MGHTAMVGNGTQACTYIDNLLVENPNHTMADTRIQNMCYWKFGRNIYKSYKTVSNLITKI